MSIFPAVIIASNVRLVSAVSESAIACVSTFSVIFQAAQCQRLLRMQMREKLADLG